MDAGELATVQIYLGIAHPSGYPLFTILGHLWSKLPLGLTPIYQLNLLASLYCGLSILFVYKGLLLFLRHRQNKYEKLTIRHILAGATGALVLAFSSTFWNISTGTEVYSLHTLLISIAFLYSLTAYYSTDRIEKKWIYTAIALGFCFSNHLTSVLLLPSMLYLFIKQHKLSNKTLQTFLKSSACFLIVVLINYSYLPIRSIQDPLLDWGNPENFSNFISHVSASQYQDFTFNSVKVAWDNLVYFISGLPSELSFGGIIIMLLGIRYAHRTERNIFNVLIITLIITILLVINYDIPDLEGYFILAYISLGGFVAFGCKWFIDKLERNKLNSFIQYSVLILPIFLFITRYPIIDKSQNHIQEDYIHNALGSMEDNAILITREFELDVSGAYYAQLVQGLRKDVEVIEIASFINWSWYSDQLKRTSYRFTESIIDKLDPYMVLLKNYEKNRSLKPEVKKQFTNLLAAIIQENINHRPIYISHLVYLNYLGPQGQIKLPFEIAIIPQDYYYRISLSKSYHSYEKKGFDHLTYKHVNDRYTLYMQKQGKVPNSIIRHPDSNTELIRYYRALLTDHRMQYELKFNKVSEARMLYNQIISKYPVYKIDSRFIKVLEND
jgi:cell division protein FtsW (lipid II flippase)